MYKKIIGYLLLSAGVLVILWTLFVSYNIFTGRSDAPEIFEVKEQTEATKNVSVKFNDPTQAIQSQIQDLMGEQIKNLIPSGSTEMFMNLAVWSMLSFILISGGANISSIGIKLIAIKKEQGTMNREQGTMNREQ